MAGELVAMSREERRRYRRNSVGQAVTGAAMLAAGQGGKVALDSRLKRLMPGVEHPGVLSSAWRSARKQPRGFRAGAHLPHLGGSLVARGAQVAALPLLAGGAAGVVKPRRNKRVSLRDDVVVPTVRASTLADQAEKLNPVEKMSTKRREAEDHLRSLPAGRRRMVPVERLDPAVAGSGFRLYDRRYVARMALAMDSDRALREAPTRFVVHADGKVRQEDGAHRYAARSMRGERSVPVVVTRSDSKAPSKAAKLYRPSRRHIQARRRARDRGMDRAKMQRLAAGVPSWSDPVNSFMSSVAKALDAREVERLQRHRQTGRTLSLASGTMGLGALGLRSPQAAASLVRRGARNGRLVRLAEQADAATKHSNTLGVMAIGTGSMGSFNYAAQQKLERKAAVGKAGFTGPPRFTSRVKVKGGWLERKSKNAPLGFAPSATFAADSKGTVSRIGRVRSSERPGDYAVGASTTEAAPAAARMSASLRKAETPEYFKDPSVGERTSGADRRLRTEVQHQSARAAGAGLAAGSSAAVASRWAGSQHAPAVMRAAGAKARAQGVPKAVVEQKVAQGMKLHEWAKPRRGRLLAAGAGLSGAAAAAGAVARWKKDETTGISQDLGRSDAGAEYFRRGEKVTKGAGTAVALEAAARGSKTLYVMTPEARTRLRLAATTAASGASGGTAGAWSASSARRRAREREALRAAGGVAKATKEQKRKRAVAASVSLGAAGVASPSVAIRVSAARALRAANRLQGHRAAGLAETLARHERSAGNVFGQWARYGEMRAENPDIKYLRPTAERWSRTWRGVQGIKRTDPDTGVRAKDVLLHPAHARRVADARVMRNMIAASPRHEGQLHRSTFHRGDGPVVSDSSPTSWTTDRTVADAVTRYHQRRNRVNSGVGRMTGRGHGRVIVGEPRTVSVGGVQALNLSSASPKFRQSEYVARVRVDKSFLRSYSDRISPDAERGWKTLRRGELEHQVSGAAQGAVGGLSLWGAMHELRQRPRNKPAVAAYLAGAGASAIGASQGFRAAGAYRGKRKKIEAKARSRRAQGLYGPGRGLFPVDVSSKRAGRAAVTAQARADNLASTA